jgi:hypothetical protein
MLGSGFLPEAAGLCQPSAKSRLAAAMPGNDTAGLLKPNSRKRIVAGRQGQFGISTVYIAIARWLPVARIMNLSPGWIHRSVRLPDVPPAAINFSSPFWPST